MKKKLKICIVKSEYNNTNLLLKKAISTLEKANINYLTISVPGAFEIPVMISKNITKYDGFIVIGSIIKGQTPNFDFISNAITNAIMQLSVNYKKPIGNAVLTCLSKNQVNKRSIKGKEAAIAVLEVLKWNR